MPERLRFREMDRTGGIPLGEDAIDGMIAEGIAAVAGTGDDYQAQAGDTIVLVQTDGTGYADVIVALVRAQAEAKVPRAKRSRARKARRAEERER